MRRDPDGTLWLWPDEWILWLWANHPDRLFDAATPGSCVSERQEAKQWRAGRGQGILARTSPLRAERERKAEA